VRTYGPTYPPCLACQNQERHFVQHHYHDHANDRECVGDSDDSSDQNRRRGGVAVSFPHRLHSVLDQVEVDGFAHVVSWSPHGRCFVIHDPKVRVEWQPAAFVYLSSPDEGATDLH
jgi:hypothetical protein